MKQLYTLALAAAVTMGVSAHINKIDFKPTSQFSKASPAITPNNANARVKLRQASNPLKAKTQRQALNTKITFGKAAIHRAAETDGLTLSEDFEAWDGSDISWLPEGWTRKMTEGLEAIDSWSPASGDESPVPIEDGATAMFCNYNDDVELNEWLITPEFTVTPSMMLSYLEMTVPLYFFSFENINWDAYEFIGDKIVFGDFKVMITTDGGENWTQLRSVVEEYMNMPLEELEMVHMGEFYNVSISLADYEGKNVKIAFVQQGRETNSVAIDAVTAGNPPMPVSMNNPGSMLNYGIAQDLSCMNFSIGHIPAYSPVCWQNNFDYPQGKYTWAYEETLGSVAYKPSTMDDPDLFLSYPPTYVDPEAEDIPYYYAPVLMGSGEGFTEGYCQITEYLAVGGDAAIDFGEEGVFNLGATAPDFAGQSYDVLTNPDYYGEPLLGYAPHSDDYWSDYTFQGTQNEKNYVKLTSLMNLHVAPDAPMVVKGAWIPALAQFSGEAELKLDLVVMSEEGEVTDNIIASGTASTNNATFITENICVLPFTFDAPVVISSEVCAQYLVRLTGFNNPDKITCFAPLHSELSDPMQRMIGWVGKEITSEGNTRGSFSPVLNYTGNFNSFYFILDAAYPYFEVANNDTVELTSDAAAEVAVDSYYSGSDFTVTAPEWVKAEVVGKGANAKVVFNGSGEPNATAEVTLSAPGVSHTFNVKMSANSAIATIDDSTATAAAYYNMQGRRVAVPTAGQIYIQRQGSAISKLRL